VEAWPLKIDAETLYNLEDNLLLFFTGFSRPAARVLSEQDEQSKANNPDMIHNLHFIKELGHESQEALESADLARFAAIMDRHWQHKKQRSRDMTNPQVDAWYELARANGALGGKMVGAGSGGFLMFYCEEKARLRNAMRQAGLTEVRFRFDFEGTKVISQG
jgi:D-glycero-alpha-D-manno-heptose-7-phosphate kinase